MTSIHTYDPSNTEAALPDLPPLPIGALVVGTLNLLQEAANLPQPRYIDISETQHVGIQFGPARSSLKAVTRWALRFGGVIISEPHQGKDGPQTYCHAEFSYNGVPVVVYAFIPATPAST